LPGFLHGIAPWTFFTPSPSAKFSEHRSVSMLNGSGGCGRSGAGGVGAGGGDVGEEASDVGSWGSDAAGFIGAVSGGEEEGEEGGEDSAGDGSRLRSSSEGKTGAALALAIRGSPAGGIQQKPTSRTADPATRPRCPRD